MKDDDENVVNPTALVAQYENRPTSLRALCYADFASMFQQSAGYKPTPQDFEIDDDVYQDSDKEDAEYENTAPKTRKMYGQDMSKGEKLYYKRHKKHIIRYVGYSRHKDYNNYCRELLMLYIPWDNEDETFPLGGDCTQIFEQEFETIKVKSQEYRRDPIDWE